MILGHRYPPRADFKQYLCSYETCIWMVLHLVMLNLLHSMALPGITYVTLFLYFASQVYQLCSKT